MISKLRRKFVTVIMCVVCLFVIGILLSLLLSSKNNYERRSELTLRQSIDRVFSLRPRDFVSDITPVTLVSVTATGEIFIHANQIHRIEDEDLPQIIEKIDANDKGSGYIDGHLRYLCRDMSQGGRRYALVDVSAEIEALRFQAIYSMIIGLGAAALFFVVSLLLSRWIVSPVETAWNRQRQFVADASHELKTPLTVVLSNADMLIASNAVSSERNVSRLDNIKAESQRMKGLIEDLLTLARSDNGIQAVRHEAVSLSYIVSHGVLTLEPAIYDAGRTIETWITNGQTVMGDPVKLRQLVEILMDNACKYSEAGSSIEVRLEPTGKRDILFSVKSEGAPIPTDEMSNIFRRFYRADKSRGEERGYGLGLAIAESIVKEHGGRIYVQSDGESSNTFFVRFTAVPS